MYERQHQRLPEQLAELVKQKILPALPIDPSSGKNFHYDSAKRLLWGQMVWINKTGELQEYDETRRSDTLGIQSFQKSWPN